MNAALARGIAFLVLWLAVAGRKPSDLPVGAAVAVAADVGEPDPRAALGPASERFRRVVIPAGFPPPVADVGFRRGAAGLASGARSPARTGRGAVQAPPGFARNAFCVIANLLPGALLTGFDPDDDQKAYVHGLDVRQPIAAELAAEEAEFMRAIGHE